MTAAKWNLKLIQSIFDAVQQQQQQQQQQQHYQTRNNYVLLGQGRLEPIGIELKSNRGGLGKEAEEKKRKAERQHQLEVQHKKRLRQALEIQKTFRQTKVSEQRVKQLEKFLRQSQKVCEQLDSQKVRLVAAVKMIYD